MTTEQLEGLVTTIARALDVDTATIPMTRLGLAMGAARNRLVSCKAANEAPTVADERDTYKDELDVAEQVLHETLIALNELQKSIDHISNVDVDAIKKRIGETYRKDEEIPR